MTPESRIMGLKINPLTMDRTVKLIAERIENEEEYSCLPVYTPNAEIFMQARQDKNFLNILNSSWLTLPDGAGLKFASRLLPDIENFPARVAGCDLLRNLLAAAARRDFDIYFLGGKPGIAAEAARRAQKQHDGLEISGCHHGYLDRVDADRLLKRINGIKPDLLFVGMGAPRQERFIAAYRESLKVRVAVTVGGSFDVLSGRVNRAPVVLQKLYLEWLYRFLKEPARWRRILRLPRFMTLVLEESLRRRLKAN
ncbi:WecB/TagA/CpsF family glycosyltransferase [Halarsenatibacter silvermanii]|uniref:N-acetylmannosaminyltransferase n=1 Tax=Halarsenatibacter silvermanii TaxID=321763 RepID=A0A1G9MMR4_9FIRM|nr:WecB/TagA/CpsF family glycosyltransferase [Halarsenatibacter silvermanii]SDL75424.1 N-acetylmannosaminyltransferase [Halarsenatibacter silvermanii]